MQLTEHQTNQPDLRKIGIHPDFWYPLARSKDLKPGKARGVSFAGEPMVLVRPQSGPVFVLEDRCSHRQMPLSKGVVSGDRVKCCYHAWCYDESGRCVQVPYLPKGAPAPGGVRKFPCREAYGLIFVFPGDPEKAQTTPFPDVPNWGKSTHKTMVFSRHLKCHYTFMHENLLDMNHQFLHRRWMGKIKPILLETRKGEDWIEADYNFRRESGKSHVGGKLLVGEQDQDTPRDYELMTIRTQYPYQTLKVFRPHTSKPAFQLFAAYVPVDKEQKVNHSFGLLVIRKPSIPGLIYLFWPLMRFFTNAVFAEDRMAVEAEQSAYERQKGDWNKEVFPLILELRELLFQQGVPLSGVPEPAISQQVKSA